MIIPVAALLLILSVRLVGGRLGRLADVRLRLLPVILLALAAQLAVLELPLPDGWPLAAVHIATYLAAACFLVANRKVPGLLLIAAGAASNGVTIAANGGVLPADPAALARAGIVQAPGTFVNSAALAHPRLAFLGDVLAMPAGLPLANVFSVGDLAIVFGAGYAAYRICGTAWWAPWDAARNGHGRGERSGRGRHRAPTASRTGPAPAGEAAPGAPAPQPAAPTRRARREAERRARSRTGRRARSARAATDPTGPVTAPPPSATVAGPTPTSEPAAPHGQPAAPHAGPAPEPLPAAVPAPAPAPRPADAGPRRRRERSGRLGPAARGRRTGAAEIPIVIPVEPDPAAGAGHVRPVAALPLAVPPPISQPHPGQFEAVRFDGTVEADGAAGPDATVSADEAVGFDGAAGSEPESPAGAPATAAADEPTRPPRRRWSIPRPRTAGPPEPSTPAADEAVVPPESPWTPQAGPQAPGTAPVQPAGVPALFALFPSADPTAAAQPAQPALAVDVVSRRRGRLPWPRRRGAGRPATGSTPVPSPAAAPLADVQPPAAVPGPAPAPGPIPEPPAPAQVDAPTVATTPLPYQPDEPDQPLTLPAGTLDGLDPEDPDGPAQRPPAFPVQPVALTITPRKGRLGPRFRSR